ncbi:2-hydroxy-acid oxidase [Burkholderia ubonensis]|nr:2-hydroxy-acid oxidase [Burkholderia ubonensis]KWF00507.1 2-hydroxy-acid oxidase [Burkholderia ubonensis]OJB18804.1 alpha-hydroxy-acid oxidizing enzyme [Burkholderia ubonensis]
MTLADVERAARAVLDGATWAYLAGGAGDERTVRANVDAFDAFWLRPRVASACCDAPDLAIELAGRRLSMPVLLAPTSPQRLMHEDAEIATARAAAAAGTISIVSTDSHYPFPEIARAGAGQCWFQLYAYGSREHVAAAIDMAAEAGAKALVVTMDAHFPARRITTRRAHFRAPPEVDFGTLRALGVFAGDVPADARLARLPLTWSDLEWVRSRTALPLLVKGVLRDEDARRCASIGANGVIVSNHGGRQLDGAMPSLVALKEVAHGASNDFIVLVDGGVRTGVDVVKAIALGADAVCIGRPYLWGLALDGQAGVSAVLELLRSEIEDALRQLSLPDVSSIAADCVAEIGWAATTGSGRRRLGASATRGTECEPKLADR